MFNNDNWETMQKKVGDEWNRLDELLKAKQAEVLLTNVGDKWKQSAMSKVDDLSRTFVVLATRTAKTINKVTEEAVKEAIDTSTEEVLKLGVNPEVVKEQAQFQLKIQLANMALENAKTAQLLINGAVREYQDVIQKAPLYDKDLFKAISRALDDHTRVPTVVYANGKNISFRAYAEMRVRTDLQNAALSNLEQSSKASGVGYFLASEHFDCADDHAKYQGKFYLADGVVDEWNGKYMRLNEAKSQGFLTRPNCRHYIMPVTKDQLGDGNLLDELNMRKGHYKKGGYDALVEQRRNERVIREFKTRENTAKLTLERAKTDEQREYARSQITQYRAKTRQWQSKQRELFIKAKENNIPIKRDYRRETPGIVIDGGVSIQKKYGLL